MVISMSYATSGSRSRLVALLSIMLNQSTVLSLPSLRRLRFPPTDNPNDKSTREGNIAARTYLASLGLLGATLAVSSGYNLRSRCELRAKNAIVWELLGKPGEEDQRFSLDVEDAIQLYNDALAGVKSAGLPIQLEEIVLMPSKALIKLVDKSMEIAAVETGGE